MSSRRQRSIVLGGRYRQVSLLIFQWAKIVLVIEQTLTSKDRKERQISYSQQMSDERRALVIRWRQSVSLAHFALDKMAEIYDDVRA